MAVRARLPLADTPITSERKRPVLEALGGRSVSTALIKGKIKLVGIPNNNDYRKDLLRQQQSTNCNH